MSVVNTMLRELAERNNAGQSVPHMPTIGVAAAPARTPIPWWFLAVLVLAILILVWRLWLASAEIAPEKSTMEETSIAAVSTQPAPAVASTADSAVAPEPRRTLTVPAVPAVTTAPKETLIQTTEPKRAANIGWELVAPTSEDDTEWSAELAQDETRQATDATSDTFTPREATNSRPEPPAPPTVFERAPAQLTRAEQLEQWRAEARTAMSTGDMASAKRAIDNGLQLQTSDTGLQLLQLEWLASQSPEQAAQRARDYLLQEPDNWAVRQWLGAQYLQQQQALLAQETLLANAPSLTTAPDYHGVLALAEQQSGAHQIAAQRYRQLTQLQPQHGRHWAGLALSQESLGQRPEAITAWRQALRDPALPAALARYGQQRLQQLLATPSTSQVSP